MDINLGGTLRSKNARETLKAIQPIIKQAGITRIANLTYLDNIGLPVYTCIRPDSQNLTTSQGKGITDDLAKCSAYMEAIETYYAENVPVDILSTDPTFDQYNKIDTKQLHPGYFSSDSANSLISQWSKVTSLITQKEHLLPTHYFKFSVIEPKIENALFKKTTTGLASGNNKPEAICHALFEIIERNALHKFKLMRTSEQLKLALDLSSIDHPEAAALLEHFSKQKVDVTIFDITNQFGRPTFYCLIGDKNPFRNLGHYAGSGTHAQKGIAICRALTEAVQSRVTYIAGSRDDMFPKDYKTKWRALNIKGIRDYTQIPSCEKSQIKTQYDNLIMQFKTLNLDILFYDHSPKDQDALSVIKCIVPGLAI